jgi:hypothetical protein
MMRVRATAVLLACTAVLAACGENSDQRAARDTVSRFYQALKVHDAGTACELMSPPVAAAFLRSSGEAGKACVPGLRDLFRQVSRSANPELFDAKPHVEAALVRGNRAQVVITNGYQRRHVDLTRTGGRWQITGSPDIR